MSKKSLKPCPFCGDENPWMESGLCAFTRPTLGVFFMAQVCCSHCSAKGAAVAGEEKLKDARKSAKRYWNEAKR